MGGGYSGNFTGTAGAIGDHQHYQVTMYDEFPVRAKPNGIDVGAAGGGNGVLATEMKQCFCCGEYTIPVGTENEICSICGWIDDKFQNTHPDSLNGRNPVCLSDAREAYRKRSEFDN